MSAEFWWGVGITLTVAVATLPATHKYNQGADKRSKRRAEKRQSKDAAFEAAVVTAALDEKFLIGYMESEKGVIRGHVLYAAGLGLISIVNGLMYVLLELRDPLSSQGEWSAVICAAAFTLSLAFLSRAIRQSNRLADFTRLIKRVRREATDERIKRLEQTDSTD